MLTNPDHRRLANGQPSKREAGIPLKNMKPSPPQDRAALIVFFALASLIALALLITGCNTTTFKQTAKDGTTVTIANSRWLWTTESYSVKFDTNGASLTANKSSTDSAAIAAVAEGLVKGMTAAKP